MSKVKGIHHVCPLCAADTDETPGKWQEGEHKEWCPRCKQYVTPDKVNFAAGIALIYCVAGFIVCGLIAWLIQ